MLLVGRATLQCQFHRGEHGQLVVAQDQGKDLDHLLVPAGTLQQLLLQPAEAFGQLQEGRAVAQCARLALGHAQVVPPVVERAATIVGAVDAADMLGNLLAFGHEHHARRIQAHADGAPGEAGWHAVAVALHMDQTGRRDPLGLFDEAVERHGYRHQRRQFVLQDLGDRALPLLRMRQRLPQGLAAILQPGVEFVQVLEVLRHGGPDAPPRVLDVLLDLSLLPARGRIAELRFEQEVADHRGEARVDATPLAGVDLVHRRLHVVVDAPPRHAAKHGKGVVVGIEQHLVGLLPVGAQQERAAVAKLELRDLQLHLLAANAHTVLAPVELKRFARCKGQRHEGLAGRGQQALVLGAVPVAGERRHAVVGAWIAHRHQPDVHLAHAHLLLARR